MMLDNKSEQKWPLTVKKVRKNEQSRVISFAFSGHEKRAASKPPQHVQYIKWFRKCQLIIVYYIQYFCFTQKDIIYFIQNSALQNGKTCGTL